VALTPAQVRTLLALVAIATSGSASDLGAGVVPAARLADRVIFNAWFGRFVPGTVKIGEAAYDASFLPISVPCAQSAESTLQSGTFRYAPVCAPYGFAGYAVTGALEFRFLADDNSSANARITGIVVYGSDDLVGFTTIYSDSTVRNVVLPNVSVEVLINRASLASTTVFRYYVAEVSVAVRSSKRIAPLALVINGGSA
jgi:hypothetical protein